MGTTEQASMLITKSYGTMNSVCRIDWLSVNAVCIQNSKFMLALFY